MKFSYTVIGQEVRIDQICNPSLVVTVPEQLEGYPVVELGAYVLSGSDVEELHLPFSLRKIGAYAFYNCGNLRRLFCYSRVLDLGTGLFAGACQVGCLDITLLEGENSCLKELLSELRQTLRVRLHMGKCEGSTGGEARLIFPEYFEESVENTPARMLFIETHGCGHRYRYCFTKTQFLYQDYDDLFFHVRMQEPEELVTELALGRLLYPCGLTKQHEQMYRDYVYEHWKTAGELMVAADRWGNDRVSNLEAGLLPWLAEGFLDREEQVGDLIDLAQQAENTEMVSWLMEFRHRRSARNEGDVSVRRKRRFEL